MFHSYMCYLYIFSLLFCIFICDINSFIQIPFEKQCQNNDACIAELVVDFNFLYVYFTNTVQLL